MDLTRQSFDVFQRFKAIGEILKSLRLPANSNLLDVGGYPGALADYLREILPVTKIITLDQPQCKRDDYVSGSAVSLPFDDASFDVAISSDMLEHLSPDDRIAAVRETLRISKARVIIAAPFQNECVDFAEEKICALYEKSVKAPHPWLSEHRKHPLPDMRAICGVIEETGALVQSFPNGSVVSWFIMEMAGILLDLYPNLFPVKSNLSLHFNKFQAEQDDVEPAYRHILVVSKKGVQAPDFKKPVSALPAESKEITLAKLDSLSKIADEISEKILSLLSDPKESERLCEKEYIHKLEQALSFQEEEQKRMREKLDDQEKQLRKIQSGFLFRLFRKFGLFQDFRR